MVPRVLPGLRQVRSGWGGMTVAAVLALAAGVSAQTVRQHLIDSVLKSNPSLAEQGTALGLRPDSLLSKSFVRDTAPLASDTLDILMPRPPRSVYERLFRGTLTNPDSMLDSLEVFGQEVFRRRAQAQAAAASPLAAPAAYPVGPGDEVVIVLWGRINQEYRLVVERDGTVNLPRIGPVAVAGMPFSAVQKALTDRVKAMEGVEASVTLGQLRSIQVYVVGEVVSPGLYTLSALSNVTTALFAAGGPTPMGSLRTMELRRGGQLVRRIDFYDFLLHGREESALRLQPGDVVLVPIVKRMAAVAGNVRRSAIYEIRKGATLPEVLELAGGVSPGGWVNRIQIQRLVSNAYQTVLDIGAPASDSIPAFAIEDGDIVKVFPVVDLDEQTVHLVGNVRRPGKYALRPGMRISDVIAGYDGLLPETYLIYAVVERFDPPSYLARIMPFNLQRVLDAPGSPGDLALQSRDRIIVYHRDYFEPDRSVSVGGAVTAPGKYKLLENMRVRDLILQAGGLREDASMVRGELYRRRLDVDTVATEKIDFSVVGAMADEPQHNLLLQRFDRVFVRQKRGWQEERTVTLVGEFVYPGTYVLFEGETLDQLVSRAGGYTSDAYLLAGILTRPSVRDLERRRIEEYVRQLEQEIVQTTAALAAEGNRDDLQTLLNQQMRILEQVRRTEPVGRVVLDLNDKAGVSSFLLEHGDVLYVPRTLQTVSVIGEVYNPATFRHVDAGRSVRHYVELSGGVKPTARRRAAYVILANGSVLSRRAVRSQRYELMPGDVVVVPQKFAGGSRYQRFSNTLDTILKLTTIASQTSTTILTIKLASE